VQEPDFDPDLSEQIDSMMDFVNVTVQIQQDMAEGYTELWLKNPSTGRHKRIWLLSMPH
jgi:hypothetical protein